MTRARTKLDLTQLLTLGAVLVSLVFAIPQAINAQATLEATRNQNAIDQQGQLTDRFTTAIDQLGSDELQIRLGGIYALERIAHDSERDHPTVMNVLATFIGENTQSTWSAADPGRRCPLEIPTDVAAALDALTGPHLLNRNRTKDQFDLSGLCLSRLDLPGADFSRFYIPDAELLHADLSGADLTDATLSNVDLFGADLRRTTFEEASLHSADLKVVNLDGADLSGAILAEAFLDRANLREAILIGSDLTDAEIRGADLSDADLARADLTYASLTNSDLDGADLSGANLTDADLTGAALAGADLSGANVTGVNPEQLRQARARTDPERPRCPVPEDSPVMPSNCSW
ncbi:pentapeptide repeat-containing protein [Saccharopolyspora sp. CA-218241]|uniref:pentapeptide repeat-containing protein n=1 Tax=Saccharopolyspora sp. CA-218241 TaxID=3240027 RepID=UPI003D97306A